MLAALLHGTPAAGVSRTLRRDTRNGTTELSQSSRGRHLYSTGRPSRWASANILVLDFSKIAEAFGRRVSPPSWLGDMGECPKLLVGSVTDAGPKMDLKHFGLEMLHSADFGKVKSVM